MSRILLTWELGLNSGHLLRLLPIASELKKRGHTVLVAVKDQAAAASDFTPEGIVVVQAPSFRPTGRRRTRLTGFADILLSQGWGSQPTLLRLVQNWINLFHLFRPEVIVADFSPTACLAAHIAGIKVVMIGNGFELPPMTDPTPPFPGIDWATPELAAASEIVVLNIVNAVAATLKTKPFRALRDVLDVEVRMLATFAELDHYGARPDVQYVGMIRGLPKGERVTWPEGSEHRVFAYVRPNTVNLKSILEALAICDMSVICVAPGLQTTRLPVSSPKIRYCSSAVELETLSKTAHLCISYGAEGTVAKFLLNGVPQLLSPNLVEGYLTARRVAELGAGLIVPSGANRKTIAAMMTQLIEEPQFAKRAANVADRYRSLDPDRSVEFVVSSIENVCNGNIENPLVSNS